MIHKEVYTMLAFPTYLYALPRHAPPRPEVHDNNTNNNKTYNTINKDIIDTATTTTTTTTTTHDFECIVLMHVFQLY